jgi:hypothetical protein
MLQSVAQEPGPRGSPQVPHPPPPALAIGGAAVLIPPPDIRLLPRPTAKPLTTRCTSSVWQVGQDGTVDARTSFSKRVSQVLQVYS